MTSLEKIERGPIAAPGAAATSGNHLILELTETLKLAAPMALAQLGHQAMMTTDLAFIGRLGSEAVAAAALGGTVYFVSFTFGMGVLSAVPPLAAQAFGPPDPHLVRPPLPPALCPPLLLPFPLIAFPPP